MDAIVGAILNAVSLAVGVAVGSYITFYLTRRQFKSMYKEFASSEAYKNLSIVLRRTREMLESSEVKAFIAQLTVILKQLSEGGESKELIAIPEEKR